MGKFRLKSPDELALYSTDSVEARLSDLKPSAPAQSRSKRALDVIGSLLGLIILSPLILMLALAVRLESAGPAIFRQERTGLGGKPFTVYKLRTMRFSEGGSTAPAEVGDARVTPLGGILRRFSLDELPQLVNILRGDMSLVGPRPHAVAHDVEYGAVIEVYNLRFRARPGMTGLSQVKGSRGGGEIAEMRRRADFDNEYIDNWTMMNDVKIMLMTLPHLLLHRSH